MGIGPVARRLVHRGRTLTVRRSPCFCCPVMASVMTTLVSRRAAAGLDYRCPEPCRQVCSPGICSYRPRVGNEHTHPDYQQYVATSFENPLHTASSERRVFRGAPATPGLPSIGHLECLPHGALRNNHVLRLVTLAQLRKYVGGHSYRKPWCPGSRLLTRGGVNAAIMTRSTPGPRRAAARVLFLLRLPERGSRTHEL